MLFFFFSSRRRHTRYWRDWSSDVCSSDLYDAAAESANLNDEYVRRTGSKSILCLPIVKQTKVVGALYLENNLTSHAFTSQRSEERRVGKECRSRWSQYQ